MLRSPWKALAIPGVALLLIGAASLAFNAITEASYSPYERGVLATAGHPPAGRQLFNANCSACHGTEANGWVGPNLHRIKNRKSDVAIIRQVTSGGTPPMPKFELSERQMADLLSYLKGI
jgi:mono/diheme cytochrome c family protein